MQTKPQKEPQKEVLTAADVALALGVGTSRVHQMIRAGELPHIRVGVRGVRIPARAFAEHLDRLNAEARASVSAEVLAACAEAGKALAALGLSDPAQETDAQKGFRLYFENHAPRR